MDASYGCVVEFWYENKRRPPALRKLFLELARRQLASLPRQWLERWVTEKYQLELDETQDHSIWPGRLITVDDRIEFCLQALTGTGQ